MRSVESITARGRSRCLFVVYLARLTLSLVSLSLTRESGTRHRSRFCAYASVDIVPLALGTVLLAAWLSRGFIRRHD